MGAVKTRKGKLTVHAKGMVYRMLAQFCGPTEIAKTINAEYGIKVSPQAIDGLRVRHKKAIMKIREYFAKNIFAIPIANKWKRLIELNKLFKESTDPEIKLKALKQAEQEIGEKEKLLADAIAKSGDRNYVAINWNGKGLDEAIAEQEAIIGTLRAKDRL